MIIVNVIPERILLDLYDTLEKWGYDGQSIRHVAPLEAFVTAVSHGCVQPILLAEKVLISPHSRGGAGDLLARFRFLQTKKEK